MREVSSLSLFLSLSDQHSSLLSQISWIRSDTKKTKKRKNEKNGYNLHSGSSLLFCFPTTEIERSSWKMPFIPKSFQDDTGLAVSIFY